MRLHLSVLQFAWAAFANRREADTRGSGCQKGSLNIVDKASRGSWTSGLRGWGWGWRGCGELCINVDAALLPHTKQRCPDCERHRQQAAAARLLPPLTQCRHSHSAATHTVPLTQCRHSHNIAVKRMAWAEHSLCAATANAGKCSCQRQGSRTAKVGSQRTERRASACDSG